MAARYDLCHIVCVYNVYKFWKFSKFVRSLELFSKKKTNSIIAAFSFQLLSLFSIRLSPIAIVEDSVLKVVIIKNIDLNILMNLCFRPEWVKKIFLELCVCVCVCLYVGEHNSSKMQECYMVYGNCTKIAHLYSGVGISRKTPKSLGALGAMSLIFFSCSLRPLPFLVQIMNAAVSRDL